MLLSVIKRRFPLVVVSVLLLTMLLLLNIPRTVFAQSPGVTLNPTQGPPSTQVTATGSNWTPGDHLQVTWDDGTILVQDATIGNNGNFTVPFTVPGPNRATPGAHKIYFTDLNSGFSLPATFTVTG